jgi:hypothetical protein
MPFDLSSAKPMDDSGGGFDLSSAKPVEGPAAPKKSKAELAYESTQKGFSPIQGLAEGIGGLATGTVMPTIANIAGLVSAPFGGGEDVKQKMLGATMPPQETAVGKGVTFAPEMIGKGIDWLGRKAESGLMPPESAHGTGAEIQRGAARGVGEAVRQLPGVVAPEIGRRMEAGLPAKQAALDVTKGEQAVADATRETSQQGGYITPPETGLKAAASGLVGKTKIEKIVSQKNAETATRNLGQEVGVPEGQALSRDEFNRLEEDAGRNYDAMTKAVGPKLQLSGAFRNTLQDTVNNIGAKIETNPELRPAQRLLRTWLKKTEETSGPRLEQPPIYDTLTKTAIEQPGLRLSRTLEQAAAESGGHAGIPQPPAMAFPKQSFAMSTDGALQAIKDLRKEAKINYRSDRPDAHYLADAKMAISDALEGQFLENLRKTGNEQLLREFQSARERFAKIYLLDRITNEATGKVDLQRLGSLADTKQYRGVLTGAFKDAADFARAYRKAAQKPTGEAAPRLTVFDGLFAIGAFAGGHPLAAAVELGGRLGLPPLAERGMLQNRTPSYTASMLPSRLMSIFGPQITGQADRVQSPPQ